MYCKAEQQTRLAFEDQIVTRPIKGNIEAVFEAVSGPFYVTRTFYILVRFYQKRFSKIDKLTVFRGQKEAIFEAVEALKKWPQKWPQQV
jgi:hypothetical protein